MKSIKLNTSAKYKNNKFQIKYLKAKKNNIVLFATYSKEDAEKVTMPMTGTITSNACASIGMNTWHRFGLISKYEFNEFMKNCRESDALNCTNPEQVVYW